MSEGWRRKSVRRYADEARLFLGERSSSAGLELHGLMAGDVKRALARTAPPHMTNGRYRAPDTLLAFLEGL